jgi:hypothetical protein
MTASAHWAWHNLQNGLAVGEAAKLEAAFFQGSAPIELYRDVYYCAAGIYIHIQVAAQVTTSNVLRFGLSRNSR